VKVCYAPDVPTDSHVEQEVEKFLSNVPTLEGVVGSPVAIFQDGRSHSYYIRCGIGAAVVAPLLDLDARLIPNSPDSFRANRDLLLDHDTFKKMKGDAVEGREFSDIIVEYCDSYTPGKPLKVWGGQHRSLAIQDALASGSKSRYHGFRIYFSLTKEQRTEVALISNTNIAISNDLFDRQLEENLVGPNLRKWCEAAGLLDAKEDFPAQGSRAERITTKLARSFMVNFFKGKAAGEAIGKEGLDKNFYEPYLCSSGATLDGQYEKLVKQEGAGLWKNLALLEAAKAFAALHAAQYKAITQSKQQITNLKGFRLKALTPSVLTAWAFAAGLLQVDPTRLKAHFKVASVKGWPDPLNAKEMSNFHHDEDAPTYRGLGTRTDLKDRQRMAQVFLARSKDADRVFDKKLLDQAVSQVVGLKALAKGYSA
jgi:hypothetical protein